MNNLDFLSFYGKHHKDSVFVTIDLPEITITLRPCTQVYDPEKQLYWDGFRLFWLLEREDYIGIFNETDDLIGYMLEDGMVQIDPRYIDLIKGDQNYDRTRT